MGFIPCAANVETSITGAGKTGAGVTGTGLTGLGITGAEETGAGATGAGIVWPTPQASQLHGG